MNPLWTQLAASAALPLTDAQSTLLSRYLDLLLDANRMMNLTRITDRPAAELQHIADALTLLPFLPRQPHRLVDVGSGGGVPGIPLAIARPDIDVTLIESTQKKARFLANSAAALNLSNLKVLPDRAETIARGPQRETFDIAVARALAPMEILAEFCLPLVRVGGQLLAMKGPKIAEELPPAEKILPTLGGARPLIHPVNLPGLENHIIVEVPKTSPTDKRYPRPASQAKRK